MTKQEIISRFDQFSKEWYGEHGFSEVTTENSKSIVSFSKSRLGFFNLDPNVFRKYIEQSSSYERAGFYLQIFSEDYKVKQSNIRISVEVFDLEDFNHDRHRMFSYVLKKVFAAFPESEYNPVDSNEGECYFVFNINATE